MVQVFRRGRVVDTLRSADSEPALRGFIDKHVAQPRQVPHVNALDAYRQGDVARAVSLAAQAALEHPEDLVIAVDVAKMLMVQKRYHQAHDLLDSLPPEAKQDEDVAKLLGHLGFIIAAEEAPSVEALEQAISADPDDLDARYRLSAVRVVQDEYELALFQLLEIVRRDPGFRSGLGQRGVLALFGVLGEEHGLVRKYAPELQAALH